VKAVSDSLAYPVDPVFDPQQSHQHGGTPIVGIDLQVTFFKKKVLVGETQTSDKDTWIRN